MKRKEKVFEIIFLLVACISIVAVAMICIFLFANGIPAMGKIGLYLFICKWNSGNGKNWTGKIPRRTGVEAGK